MVRPWLLVLCCVACGAVPASTPDAGDGASTPDAGRTDPDAGLEDGGSDGGQLKVSPCVGTADLVRCTHQTITFDVAALARRVHWQVPAGTPPATGWPAVLLFQGSFLSAAKSWEGHPADAFGGFFQAQVVHTLLDNGFAVVTPEAKLDGATYWDTNIPPYAWAWTTSADHALMLRLFDELAAGTFGLIDTQRLYAAGISSGGYMTSRMAEAYPGRFRALAIQSASWETCGGATCVLPSTLPADHPPTLFLHGDKDLVVPLFTAQAYEEQLRREGHETRFVQDADAGHEWLPVSPAELLQFFAHH